MGPLRLVGVATACPLESIKVMPLVFNWLPMETTETPVTMSAAESRTARLRQARLNRLRLAERVVSTPWRGFARLYRGSGLLKDILVGRLP